MTIKKPRLRQIKNVAESSAPPHPLRLLRLPPAPILKTQKRDNFRVRIFLLAAFFRTALPLSERRPDVRFLSKADIKHRVPLWGYCSFDQHQCRPDLNDLRARKHSC
jgi:hypothetical protein